VSLPVKSKKAEKVTCAITIARILTALLQFKGKGNKPLGSLQDVWDVEKIG
jgi:hypothetical protein